MSPDGAGHYFEGTWLPDRLDIPAGDLKKPPPPGRAAITVNGETVPRRVEAVVDRAKRSRDGRREGQ